MFCGTLGGILRLKQDGWVILTVGYLLYKPAPFQKVDKEHLMGSPCMEKKPDFCEHSLLWINQNSPRHPFGDDYHLF